MTRKANGIVDEKIKHTKLRRALEGLSLLYRCWLYICDASARLHLAGSSDDVTLTESRMKRFRKKHKRKKKEKCEDKSGVVLQPPTGWALSPIPKVQGKHKIPNKPILSTSYGTNKHPQYPSSQLAATASVLPQEWIRGRGNTC